MKILLVDADSKIPNLALMKLSTFYKNKGYKVILKKLNIPFSPYRKKKIEHIRTDFYEKVYCSIIFDNHKNLIKGENIIFGGTGFDINISLPKDIEEIEPDYSLYKDNDFSYGFISRGCIRKCYFCKVPEKEGNIHQVNTIDSIVKHKITKFLDNNILALPNHKDILQELIDKKIKCQFNQGLDIRLLDKENSLLLSKLNYHNEYIFAFDDWKYLKLIEKKLSLLSWRRDWQLKFFVYVNPKMDIQDTVKRLEYLKDKKCLPYLMRDISCYKSIYKDFYNDLSTWVNVPRLFKTTSFEEFIRGYHTTKSSLRRVQKSIDIYNNVIRKKETTFDKLFN